MTTSDLREAVARVIEPGAWDFHDRHIVDQNLGAECRYETAKSLTKADDLIALILSARDPLCLDCGAKLEPLTEGGLKHLCQFCSDRREGSSGGRSEAAPDGATEGLSVAGGRG